MSGAKPGVREARRIGDWNGPAVWLAERLNALDGRASERARPIDSHGRAELHAATRTLVGAVDGDMADADVVHMRDGTRVCWHAESGGSWIVESAADLCRYRRLAAG